MSACTTLGYSEFISADKQDRPGPKTIRESDAVWERSRNMLVKLLGCDETPLKSPNLDTRMTYHYSKENNLLVKIDSDIRKRIPMARQEADIISALNNLSKPLLKEGLFT